MKEENCDFNLEFEVSFFGDDNFGDDWYKFDIENRRLIIDLEAIKNVIKKKKLVRGEVKAAYKDLEGKEITSDSIAFNLKFEPAEEEVDVSETTNADEPSTDTEKVEVPDLSTS